MVVCLFACNSSLNRPIVISPNDRNDVNVELSFIAKDIEYIPLDNNIPVGPMYSLHIDKHYIYLSVKEVGVIQFNREGKYVRNIGHYGRGPEEYRGIYFAVDESNQRIYILDREKIKVFSNSGIFLKDLSYKKYIAGGAGGIQFFKSLLFLPDFFSYGNSEFNWILLDTLGNLISSKINTTPSFETSMRGYCYKFDNKLIYYNSFNDTIFSIAPNLKYKAEYFFSSKIDRTPKEVSIDYISQLFSLFRTGKMVETKHFLLLEYGYFDKIAFLLIDKNTGRKYQAYEEKIVNGKLINNSSFLNDVDAGMPLSINSNDQIFYYFEQDGSEHLAHFINPFALKMHTSSDHFRNSIPVYPEKKLGLEEFANGLKETDNPILVLIKSK